MRAETRKHPRAARSGLDEREQPEMTRRRAGSDADRAKGRDRPVNHVDREASRGAGAGPPSRSRNADSLGRAFVPDRPWFADAPEWQGGDEDEVPVFDGGDESRLFGDREPDRLRGPTDELAATGGTGRGPPLGPRKANAAHSDDEEDAPCWGNRRTDECPLSFLGGDDSVSCLGDGEDLP